MHSAVNRTDTVCYTTPLTPLTFQIPRSNGIATRANPRSPYPSQYTQHTDGRQGSRSSAEIESAQQHIQTNRVLTATASILY